MPQIERLCLFRLDPVALDIQAYCVLDNGEGGNVTDGYYAIRFYRETDGPTGFDVITYKGVDGHPPQIVLLEYDWNDVR